MIHRPALLDGPGGAIMVSPSSVGSGATSSGIEAAALAVAGLDGLDGLARAGVLLAAGALAAPTGTPISVGIDVLFGAWNGGRTGSGTELGARAVALLSS